MDPQETLWNLLDSMERNDREAVGDALTALAEWNNRGGFQPQVERANTDGDPFIVRSGRDLERKRQAARAESA